MQAIVTAVAAGLIAVSALFTPAQAADGPVVLIARFYVAPGQESAFEERSKKGIEFVRKAEPDIIVYRLDRSTKDPSQYVFFEVYPSQAALDRHAKETLPAFAKLVGPRPEGLFTKPPEIEKLAPVGGR